MKKPIFILAVTVILAATVLKQLLSSVKKPGNAQDKVQQAKDKVVKAEQELNLAMKEAVHEFKKASERMIGNNEKSLAELKTRLAGEQKDNKAHYERKLRALEQKNTDMKRKLEDYKEEGREKWDSFKTVFNHNMDDLGKSISHVFSNEKESR
jgi:hypothetical protein